MNEIIFNGSKNVIYKNLRRFRKERGLTQDQLAARMQVMNVNLTQGLISRIEHNDRIVTDYELACFCRAQPMMKAPKAAENPVCAAMTTMPKQIGRAHV